MSRESTTFCTTVTAELARRASTITWSSFSPARPPATEPRARGMAVPKGILVRASICLPMDTTDMENTVREESTPMVCTSKPWSTSISGLMMTPPPMPVREPTVVAPMAMRK